MTVKNEKLPVIQKTLDETLVNIDGHTFQRFTCMEPINVEAFNRLVEGRELITWDSKFKQEE